MTDVMTDFLAQNPRGGQLIGTTGYIHAQNLFQTTSSPPFFLRDSRTSETRAGVKITPREKRRHAACRLFQFFQFKNGILNPGSPTTKSVKTPLVNTLALYCGTRIEHTGSFVPNKSCIFKLTRLKRTPVNTDKGNSHFPLSVLSRVKDSTHQLSYIVNPALRTLTEYLISAVKP